MQKTVKSDKMQENHDSWQATTTKWQTKMHSANKRLKIIWKGQKQMSSRMAKLFLLACLAQVE